MRKICIMFICIAFMIGLQGCQKTTGVDEAYLTAFEVLLENSDLSDPICFISLFINDTHLLDEDVESVERVINQTYEREVFTYTPDEISHVGPYGKEDVSLDGLFLYLLEIEHEDDTLMIEAAAFHTISDRGAFGMEIVVTKTDDEWIVQDTILLWQE